MSPTLRDIILSALELRPQSRGARTDSDDPDTLSLSDLNAAADPADDAAWTALEWRQASTSTPPPAPPSYNEAMTTSLSGRSTALSELLQQFFHGGELNCLVLTEAARSVVCLYYDLLQDILDGSPHLVMWAAGGDRKSPAMLRLMIHSFANYAFMLAIVHSSSRYRFERGSPIYLRRDEEVHAIRTHVLADMLQGWVNVNPNWSNKSFFIKSFADEVESWLKFYPKYSKVFTINRTLNTGKLDGPAVQECWRLFKAALAQAGGGMHNLLPPSGYKSVWRAGYMRKQKCLRPLFDRECDCPLSRTSHMGFRGALKQFFHA